MEALMAVLEALGVIALVLSWFLGSVILVGLSLVLLVVWFANLEPFDVDF